MSHIDDTIDIDLRSPEEIAARMTILLATSLRESMEYGDESEPDAYGSETDRFDLYAWARSTYREFLSPRELDFLAAPAGSPDDDTVLNFAMDGMSALALGWALGLVDTIPTGDRAAVPLEAIRATAPKPWDRADKLLRKLEPRREEDVWRERERWDLRRIRFLLEQVEDDAERQDALADLTTDALGLEMRTTGEDIFIDDRTVADLDDDEFAVIAASIDATVRALTWACGVGGDWDDVSADLELD